MAKVASGKKPATKKSAPAKKTAAKKPPAKVAAKKAVGKVAAKKASAKKPVPAKKAAGKKSPASAKKALATKRAAKSAARGSTKQAAKSRTTKTPAKKLPAKPTPKAPAKKSTAKRATAEVKAAPAPVAPKSIYAREEVKLPKGAVFCPLSGIIVTPQKPNINPKTLARLRAVLEEELAKHIRQADDLRAEADQLASEREQGDTQFDEESGEGDTVSVERERDLLLSASARQTVDEIRAALERMDAGTYGLCTPAGRRINIARLDAIPWADQCVDCKSARERRR